MLIEIEIGGKLTMMNTQSVKVILPIGRYHRSITVTEEGIEVDVMDDDGDVVGTANLYHHEILDVQEDALEEDR